MWVFVVLHGHAVKASSSLHGRLHYFCARVCTSLAGIFAQPCSAGPGHGHWDWDGGTLGCWAHARLGCSGQEETTPMSWSLLDSAAPFTSLTLSIFISSCQFCLVYHIQVYHNWPLKKKIIFIVANGIRMSDANKADIFQFLGGWCFSF